MGFDPREVVPAVLASQALLGLPVLFEFRYSHSLRSLPVKAFVFLTTVLGFVIPLMIKGFSKREIMLLYFISLMSVITLYSLRSKIKLRLRYWVLAFSFLAAFDKAVVGGGLSAVTVAFQAMLGINLREALALLPALKLLPVLGTLLGYSLAGLMPQPLPSLFMAFGAFGGTYLARKALKGIRAGDERLALAFLIVSALLALFRAGST
jgi:hypothetical protein